MTCTVSRPGFGRLMPAFEKCEYRRPMRLFGVSRKPAPMWSPNWNAEPMFFSAKRVRVKTVAPMPVSI